MSPWVGKSYLLSVPEDNWIDPQGIGPEIGPHVPSFLMRVDAGTSDSVSLTLTSADATGAQEMCTPTTTVAATTGGPYPGVQIGPVDFPVHLKNQNDPVQVNATIRGLTITNVLPGAAPAEEGELMATMDMREIYPMFTLLTNPDPDSVCNALESFEAPCEPCTDGQLYCLTITAILLGATETTSAITPVAAPTCVGASD